MAKYFFVAKSLKGEEITGIEEAKNETDLAHSLRQKGYILISATKESEIKKRGFSFQFQRGVPFKEKLLFVRNLQVMISAGVSLPKAIEILSFQTKNKKFKKVLYEITQKIIKGKSFSEALSEYPEIFSEFFCNMIKVGEEGGNLERNLGILVKQMEKERELKNKIKGALIYPAVIVSAMIGIGILMLVMVVPKLARTFEELNMDLPLTTKVVIKIANFLLKRWYLVLIFLVGVLFLGRFLIKTKKGKRILSKLLFKIPLISDLVKKTNAAYTVRTLGSLMSSGVALLRALEIVANTIGNFYFKKSLKDAKEKVKKGMKLSDALKEDKEIYPPSVIQMLAVGEETGKSSEILQKLADFYEEEVSRTTKNLISVIEPLLMLIIGGAVGFFAISMIQPMYSMLSGLK